MDFTKRLLLLALLVVVTTTWASTAAEAAGPRRPNILFAISDDQSWMHAGAYGDTSTRTPAFDRVAREGALFQYAYTACPSCAPSRAAILTGRHIWELEEGGILFGILRPKFGAFTLQLEAAGYQLAHTGKTYSPGKYADGWRSPVFGQPFQKRRVAERRPGINPTDYAANFADFLEQRNGDQPFFFWFGATEPHQSYDIGAWKAAGKSLADARLPGCLPDSPVTRGEILDYGLEIEHFDHHLGRMLGMLEEAGELDNTIVVVTSDHGNPLPRSKCNLYDTGTRVPLAVRWPAGLAGGQQVDRLVSLVDVGPTLLDLAGAAPLPDAAGASWRSMLLPVEGRPQSPEAKPYPERKFVVTGFERHIVCRRYGVGYPMRCIRTPRYAYIRNYEPDRWPAGDPDFVSSHQGFFGDCDRGSSKDFLLEKLGDPAVRPYYLRAFGRRPGEELYDMQQDPWQLVNLAEQPELAEVKRELAQQLEQYLRARKDPRLDGSRAWDTYPFIDPRIFRNPRWETEGHASPLPNGETK